MKKIVSGILIVVMLLSLTGCSSKSDDVKKVERLIKGIGTVALDKEQYIIDAEEAYNMLPMVEKDSVGNYKTLEKARKQFDTLYFEKLLNGLHSIDGKYWYRDEFLGKVFKTYTITITGDTLTFELYANLSNTTLVSGKYAIDTSTAVKGNQDHGTNKYPCTATMTVGDYCFEITLREGFSSREGDFWSNIESIRSVDENITMSK